jgi:hypothetical protein
LLKSSLLKLLFITATLLMLNSCGGGSSSSSKTENANNTSSNNQNTTPLKVHAGSDRIAQINKEITIRGYITGTGDIGEYEWKKDNQVLATTLEFTYIPTQLGIDTLVLEVINNDGIVVSDSLEIEVREEYHDYSLPFH